MSEENIANILIALITAIGSIIGGYIGARATIIAADKNAKANQTFTNKEEKSFSWSGIFMGALVGAVVTLTVLFLLGTFPPLSIENPPIATATKTSSFVATDTSVLITPIEIDLIPNSKLLYEADFKNRVNFLRDWNQFGKTDIVDGILVIEDKDSGVFHKTALGSGNAILVLFRNSAKADSNIVVFDRLTDGEKYIGIKPDNSSNLMVSLGYFGEWFGGQRLEGNLSYVNGNWYYGFVEIRENGQFYLKIWDANNPSFFREQLVSMGDEWANASWYGSVTSNQFSQGQVEVSAYYELQIDPNSP